MQITKDFTIEEMTSSPTARGLSISNRPSSEAVARLKALCREILQPLRDAMGEPIIITSGYRSPELNRAVGGSPTSQHTRGEAVDIKIKSGDNARAFYYILDHLPFDQLIWEWGDDRQPRWVHVSFTMRGGRRQALRKRAGWSHYERFEDRRKRR